MDDLFRTKHTFSIEVGINMYIIYKNLRLNKEKNFVTISAEGFMILESIEDEGLIGNNFPKFLHKLIESKFPEDKYATYNIYTLSLIHYNKVTDYKKIWKLANFETIGLYDNHYDGDNGRIYFGISKGSPHLDISILTGKISIFVPKEVALVPEDIFELFAKNTFDISLDREKHYSVLSSLQKLVPKAIVVYKLHNDGNSLNIYGDNVAQLFNEEDLPLSEVIER